MRKSSASPSSSIDSTSNVLITPLSPSSPNSSSSSSSICLSSNLSNLPVRRSTRRSDLSTDLRLGLSISSSPKQYAISHSPRENPHRVDWPPIKPILRTALSSSRLTDEVPVINSLFVKVYMEGIPIGRKLDLLNHDGYGDLTETLAGMFKTPILCPNRSRAQYSHKYYVLTYEDREGDWMMVGDVPWEIFISTVKRLKITRADRC